MKENKSERWIQPVGGICLIPLDESEITIKSN